MFLTALGLLLVLGVLFLILGTAPSPGVRGTPAGIKLPDGVFSKIDVALSHTLSFWEKQPKLPDMDGGEKVDQTTMHNVSVRTALPQSLVDFGDFTCKAAFDLTIFNSLWLTGSPILNVNTTITFNLHNGDSLALFGWIRKIEFDAFEIGKQPECTVTFSASNLDPTTFVEAKPVMTPYAGTDT